MSTGYLSFLTSHPFTWGSLGIVLLVLGAGFLLPRLGLGRSKRPPPRRAALALYLWAGAVLCFVAVFFVPLRLRFFTEVSLYFHGALFLALILLLVLRRIGLFIAFAVFLVIGVSIPLYHQTWQRIPEDGNVALVRVLSVSSAAISLEIDAGESGPGEILGPVELTGTLLALEVELAALPEPLFFLGFADGYRLLRVIGLDEDGQPVDEWSFPTRGGRVPLLDRFVEHHIETVNLRPILMEQFRLILRPEANQVLSYKQL
jgi:hypothetical protein